MQAKSTSLHVEMVEFPACLDYIVYQSVNGYKLMAAY